MSCVLQSVLSLTPHSMFTRLFFRRSPLCGHGFQHSKPLLSRPHFTTSNASRSYRRTRPLIAVAGVTAAAVALLLANESAHVYADAERENGSASQGPQSAPMSELIRSYFVYTMCSFPTLVDWSPTILDTFTSIPGLKQITEAFIERTFFKHVRHCFALNAIHCLTAAL